MTKEDTVNEPFTFSADWDPLWWWWRLGKVGLAFLAAWWLCQVGCEVLWLPLREHEKPSRTGQWQKWEGGQRGNIRAHCQTHSNSKSTGGQWKAWVMTAGAQSLGFLFSARCKRTGHYCRSAGDKENCQQLKSIKAEKTCFTVTILKDNNRIWIYSYRHFWSHYHQIIPTFMSRLLLVIKL